MERRRGARSLVAGVFGAAALGAVLVGLLVLGAPVTAEEAGGSFELTVSGGIEHTTGGPLRAGEVRVAPAAGDVSAFRLRQETTLEVSLFRFLVLDLWVGLVRIEDEPTTGSDALLPVITADVTRDVEGEVSVTARGTALAGFAMVDFELTLDFHPDDREGDPVLVGAGDISLCALPTHFMTAALLDRIPGTVFTLGDNAYMDGTVAEFMCYDLSWGRHGQRTKPSVGNHEYHTQGALPYYRYFGEAAGETGKGWYSYDLGSWHVVVLNSNCEELDGGCEPGSEQIEWLLADLAAHERACTLAYWHHARFSSSDNHGSDPTVQPFWEVLYTAGADVVLSGHDHTYERFAPQSPEGVADPEFGIREFVVGTGGNVLYGFATPEPNSEVRNSSAWGVMKLALHDAGYDWEFVPVDGRHFRDSGSDICHPAP